MKITFNDSASFKITPSGLPAVDAIALPIGKDKKLSAALHAINKAAGGAITKALEPAKFSGKQGQYLSLTLPSVFKARHLILVGIESGTLTAKEAENIGGGLVAHLHALGAKTAAILCEGIKPIKGEDVVARMAYGAKLRSYRFDKYHTKMKPEDKPSLTGLTFYGAGGKASSAAFSQLEKIAEGVFFTRDLVNEPANIINPETLADKCRELSKLGIEVDVLGEDDLYKLGMGALLGVGQGSAFESQLVIMQWKGLGKGSKTPPVAFVGKGVTFDTGGISIKPAAGMEEMKWDMGGAGTVIGLMKALAGRKAKVNAIGVVGLVENMPSGTAQRPGDVVTSYSGQTIEVLNTDAEGRLVLADALWYTQERFKPKFMINLATLTGAIIVSLGSSRAGLFSNNDALADKLFATGQKIGEELWRLPLADVYDKMIDSDIADMQNIGKDREAGSITAAQFLQRFVNDVPWAHLDIAGVAWCKKDQPTVPKGGTAFGVRLLDALVKDHYEAK